jgi:hypothetical protein
MSRWQVFGVVSVYLCCGKVEALYGWQDVSCWEAALALSAGVPLRLV